MPAAAPAGGCAGGNCGSGGATTPLYSSLMTLPVLTPEKRAEIDALATQQTNEGMARLVDGSESLNHATQAGDNLAMHRSVGLMREALDELEAGIAARRVLAEGKAPRNLALDWFKREMNLASPVPSEGPRTFLGVTPFHLFTMGLLVSFALAMLAMYFFKMRRAAALFGRLEDDAGKVPPGSSPPLAGAPKPAAAPAAPASAAAPAPSPGQSSPASDALAGAPKPAAAPAAPASAAAPAPSPGQSSPAPDAPSADAAAPDPTHATAPRHAPKHHVTHAHPKKSK